MRNGGFLFLSIKVVIKYFLHKSIDRLRHGGYEKICYDGHFCSIIKINVYIQ